MRNLIDDMPMNEMKLTATPMAKSLWPNRRRSIIGASARRYEKHAL
jgi:hypothetical protein